MEGLRAEGLKYVLLEAVVKEVSYEVTCRLGSLKQYSSIGSIGFSTWLSIGNFLKWYLLPSQSPAGDAVEPYSGRKLRDMDTSAVKTTEIKNQELDEVKRE